MDNYIIKNWQILGKIDDYTNTAVIAHENYPSDESTVIAHVFRLSQSTKEFKKAANIVKKAPEMKEKLETVLKCAEKDLIINKKLKEEIINILEGID